jgi:hypothetical protein
MLNWKLLQGYLSGDLFESVNSNEVQIIQSSINLKINYKVIQSEWLKNRIEVFDENMPEEIELANTVNMAKMTTYPIFSELDLDKILDFQSETLSNELKLEPNLSQYSFAFNSKNIDISSRTGNFIFPL